MIPASGTPEEPILFGSYGDGKQPLIMRSEAFSDWTLMKQDSRSSTNQRIWVGKLPGLRNSWGLVWNGKRMPSYQQHIRIKPEDMADRYFFSPLNSGRFYFRNDSGNPGTVEIGARTEAIRIVDRHDIVIDGIDVFGPGGRPDAGSATGFMAVYIGGNSRNITLRNMSVTHGNSIAISAAVTTRAVSYVNLTTTQNGGTGIYLNSHGGKIVKCKSFDNGRLATDKGDRGGIGSYRGRDLTIESNEVFRNGPEGGTADFEVSMVATGPVNIMRNFVHDCIQGCIQIAEGGDNSLIAYNIISGYGTVKKEGKSSPGHNSGIRIGGGTGGARNIHIYNNVLHGGRQPASAVEAGIYVGPYDNSGLAIRNNIFSDNSNRAIYIRGRSRLGNFRITNNLFSSLVNALNWKEKEIRTLRQWKTYTGLDDSSVVADPGFHNDSGVFSDAADFKPRLGSPVIDAGADVGLDRDYDGSTVPTGSAPDIGAFEFTPGA